MKRENAGVVVSEPETKECTLLFKNCRLMDFYSHMDMNNLYVYLLGLCINRGVLCITLHFIG